MDAVTLPDTQALRPRGFINRLAASRRFQAFCARIPGLRGISRREGAALFDMMQGFVQSQVLAALVEMRVLHLLVDGPLPPATLAARTNAPPERMQILLQAGAAMGLLRRQGSAFGLARRGAAFLSIPGLSEMVRHHTVLYGDLSDPAAFFRGEVTPALAEFWPYVFGAAGAMDPDVTARYSKLMADSQILVAEEALAHLSLKSVKCLMDVGGGTGTFLRAVRARHPSLQLALFDLPDVVAQAPLPADILRHGGSFRSDDLPPGADMITLVRVLYDHADDTVAGLLQRVHDALPQGGRIAIIEPMSGGTRPDLQTDVYFTVYTLAMQTGRTRSADEIRAMLKTAGFTAISAQKTTRPYISSVLEARKD